MDHDPPTPTTLCLSNGELKNGEMVKHGETLKH
jgi:hypothetical protein